jgi:hypothetical protein
VATQPSAASAASRGRPQRSRRRSRSRGGWFGPAGRGSGLRRAVAGVVLRDQRLPSDDPASWPDSGQERHKRHPAREREHEQGHTPADPPSTTSGPQGTPQSCPAVNGRENGRHGDRHDIVVLGGHRVEAAGQAVLVEPDHRRWPRRRISAHTLAGSPRLSTTAMTSRPPAVSMTGSPPGSGECVAAISPAGTSGTASADADDIFAPTRPAAAIRASNWRRIASWWSLMTLSLSSGS